MKVLHVITTINRGGAENHLRDLIHGQIRVHRCKIGCAYLKGNGYWTSDLSLAGADVFPLQLSRYGELAPLVRLRKAISQLQPDIVHAHLAPGELYARGAMLAAKKTRFVISRHNHNRFFDGPGAALVERWVVQRADRIIAISESVKRHFSAQWPIALGSHFEVVPYGIDPKPYVDAPSERAMRLREEWGLKHSTVLIGAVGRMVAVKGFDVLLEGYAHLRAQSKALDIKLVLVGGGPLEQELKKRASELGVGNDVIWAGFREDMPVVMNALDALVLTSHAEGFGLVLLEAMSASKPVICTNVSALPEIVVQGETGLLIPPSDPRALAQAIELLASNAELRVSYGRAGYARVVSRFSLASMFSRTMAVYERVLHGKGN